MPAGVQTKWMTPLLEAGRLREVALALAIEKDPTLSGEDLVALAAQFLAFLDG